MKLSLEKSKNLNFDIEHLESIFNHVIPEPLRSLIIENSGVNFPSNCLLDYDYLSIERLLSFEQIVNANHFMEGIPKDVLVFASAFSGDFFCYDFSKKKIIYWNHEVEDDVLLSFNIESFFGSLTEVNDPAGLKPDILSSWVDEDFKPVFD